MYRLVIFLFCVSSTLGQLLVNSACQPSNVTSVTNFNLAQFSGVWRQIERIENTEEQDGDCFTTTFTATSPAQANTSATIFNSWVLNRAIRTRNGTILRSDYETDGRFTVSYSDAVRPYVVIATDYTGYALVFSCYTGTNENTQRVWAWKLSRNSNLSTNQITQINTAIAANPILQQASWRSTSHTTDACRSSSAIFYSSATLVLLMAFLGLNKQ